MKLLIDTCTFLWLAEGSSKLSAAAVDAFVDPANECYLSAASAWEIAIKHARNKIMLPQRPEVFIPSLRELGNIASLAVGEEAVVHVGKLPWIHPDPFDRVLIAQAIVHGMTILTSDEEIQQYPVMTLW